MLVAKQLQLMADNRIVMEMFSDFAIKQIQYLFL